MTRGNFVLVTDDKILMSCQFNGDMYPIGRGLKAYALLEGVTTEEEFENAVRIFRDVYFPGYCETDIHEIANLDFSRDYYGSFNSDYLYIKNIGSAAHPIVERESGNFKVIEPGEIQVWYYGDYLKVDLDDLPEMEMIRMLKGTNQTPSYPEPIHDLAIKCQAKIDKEYSKFVEDAISEPILIFANIEKYAAIDGAYRTFCTFLSLEREHDRAFYEKFLDTPNPLYLHAVDYLDHLDQNDKARRQVESTYRVLSEN